MLEQGHPEVMFCYVYHLAGIIRFDPGPVLLTSLLYQDITDRHYGILQILFIFIAPGFI
jgi:hypothetical protein